MNSRNKGKRGELEAAKFLASEGFPARRGQQFSGGADSPDIICESLPGIHFEVKRCEKGNPYDWMTQAERDGGYKIPVVLHRRNDHKWLAILPAEQFLRILRESDFVEAKAKKRVEQKEESRKKWTPERLSKLSTALGLDADFFIRSNQNQQQKETEK